MIPWHKLSNDTQKTILALFVMSGSAASTRCCPPVICDPPPPPRTSSPIPPRSPIICDPAPPPSITPTRFQTPVICDPPPPPARTPTPVRSPIICDPAPPPSRTTQSTATPTVQRKFQLRSLQMTTDATLPGAVVRGKVLDAKGQPLANIPITMQGSALFTTVTASDGSFSILVTNFGAYSLFVGGDKSSAVPLQLKNSDMATVEYQDLGSQSQLILPLAEIRAVDIVWGDALTFQVDTPWQGARYRWSVSGGALIEEGDSVTWEPPAEPGRYLLQLIADWGRDGLAVDVLTLTVTEDGFVYIG